MKKVLALVLIGMVAVGVHANPILEWGSDLANGFGTGPDIYDWAGAAVPQTSGWLAELVDTSNDNILFSSTTGFDAVGGVFYQQPGTLFDLAEQYNGTEVKTVFWSDVTKISGFTTELSERFTFSWDTGQATPGTLTYNIGSNVGGMGTNPGQWQAIPEPAVAGLIGLFGGGMLVVRRLFFKA